MDIHRATWAAGNYAAVRDLLGRITITPGQDVLDVTTGTGNTALAAAAAGAHVTGLDLTPELFSTARQRAAAAHVDVRWIEGDAEDLPFVNDTFDHVVSVFGVQFAPRHDATAAELVRVCRPGSDIAVINWIPAGAIGELFKIVGSYLPAPPAFASPPPLWGSEAHVTKLFEDTEVELSFDHGRNPWRFDSADHWAAFLETTYGPTVKAHLCITSSRAPACDCKPDLAANPDRVRAMLGGVSGRQDGDQPRSLVLAGSWRERVAATLRRRCGRRVSGGLKRARCCTGTTAESGNISVPVAMIEMMSWSAGEEVPEDPVSCNLTPMRQRNSAVGEDSNIVDLTM